MTKQKCLDLILLLSKIQNSQYIDENIKIEIQTHIEIIKREIEKPGEISFEALMKITSGAAGIFLKHLISP